MCSRVSRQVTCRVSGRQPARVSVFRWSDATSEAGLFAGQRPFCMPGVASPGTSYGMAGVVAPDVPHGLPPDAPSVTPGVTPGVGSGDVSPDASGVSTPDMTYGIFCTARPTRRWMLRRPASPRGSGPTSRQPRVGRFQVETADQSAGDYDERRRPIEADGFRLRRSRRRGRSA